MKRIPFVHDGQGPDVDPATGDEAETEDNVHIKRSLMASKLLTVAFWSDVVERAVKSAAQAPLLALGLSDTGPVDAFELDFGLAAGFAAGGALISVLTSIASAPVGQGGTASLLPSPPAPPPPPAPDPDPLPPPQ